LYDARFNFLQVSGAIVKARISLGKEWVNLIKTETNGYTLDSSDKSGMSNKILTQDSFTIQLWNAKGEMVQQTGLTPSSFQKSGGLFTGDSDFQFTAT
jgi:hypothetical protein